MIDQSDPGVSALKRARNSSAVLKLELAKLRSSAASLAILVFEGDDDKIVYSQWLNRTRSDLRYAMFTCSGKTGLLSLRHALLIDRTGLQEGIFFFADRDFDDLRGQASGPDIFLTDKYSVENYLVCEAVVESLLKVEFHCNLHPDIVTDVVRTFSDDYEAFIALTKAINCRLFVARTLRLDVKTLPTSVAKIASVEIGLIGPGSLSEDDAVCFAEPEPEPEPEPEEFAALVSQFELLCGRDRYRGKFAYLFLAAWLRKLAAQRDLPSGGLFARLQTASAFRTAELTLSNFASKSPLPDRFHEFVATIPNRLAA